MLVSAVLLGTALGVLTACGSANGKDGKDKQDQPQSVPVEVAPPTVGPIVAVYSGTAPVEAAQESRVVAKVGGEVRQILVEEGSRVRA
ncbi:MAG: efflux RND transporter periplasmic adaptor subunit, partial [Gammaproteobacteria bacterium]|nr:efflux RND transporter periplasmic adaptor subunit [Gammaproteobacteria bacterium]